MASSNNTGPGTSSPWNASPYAFAPSTNVLDRNSMPSDKAEAARQKSALIMEALKNGDKGEADRLMGKENKPQGQIVPRPNIKGWFKRKGAKKGKEGNEADGKEYEESVASSGVEKESVMGKDDGVIR